MAEKKKKEGKKKASARETKEEKEKREKKLLRLFANNARALEALDAERREVMVEFKQRRASLKESNVNLLAELNLIENPPPLVAHIEQEQEKEEKSAADEILKGAGAGA